MIPVTCYNTLAELETKGSDMHGFRNYLASTLMVLMLFTNAAVTADEILADGHPNHYVVQKGDTLWDIASRFLRDPWRWPDIWHVNPAIANPHLIYPGDELDLTYVDGMPQLGLRRGGKIKLSPGIRARALEDAIHTVPIDAIGPFLTRPYVLDPEVMDAAPYVLAFPDEHLIAGVGQRLYARSITSDEVKKFDVLRAGKPYKDASTGAVIGHEAMFIGTAKLQRTGDPATLVLTDTKQEVLVGDRLLPITEDAPLADFMPRAANPAIKGAIIDVYGGVTQVGQYNVVVLDRGAQDGLLPGDVMQIDQRGLTVDDRINPQSTGGVSQEYLDKQPERTYGQPHQSWKHDYSRGKVTLPDEKAGLLMVFRTFERVSFALVMDAYKNIKVLDKVRSPE